MTQRNLLTLGEKELAAFTAIVDTLLPVVEGDGPAWTTPGEQLGFADRLPELFDRLPHDQDRKDLRRFLGLLNAGFGGLVLYGKPKAFPALAPDQRADAFRKMESHRFGLIRGGAKVLKTMAALLWMTTDDAANRPASWEAIGYPGPDGSPPRVSKTLPITSVSDDTTMSCDVVVVGSGAGGGTAAGILAQAGLDVIVLEAGAYRNESDFTHLEADAYRDLYLDGALNIQHLIATGLAR